MNPGAPQPWLTELVQRLRRQPAVVRVVVAGTRGSAPREMGAGMLVDTVDIEGSIGGGQLEWEAIAAARDLLDAGAPAARYLKRVLGADLRQCCGGVVDLWLECFTPADLPLLEQAAEAARLAPVALRSRTTAQGLLREVLPADSDLPPVRVAQALGSLDCTQRLQDERPAVWLFGAGHVGQALARILVELPLRLTWIDSRPGMLPAQLRDARLLHAEHPRQRVAEAPPGTCFIIMTHSHDLDYELCRAVLLRGDATWSGLIGSDSKSARFRSRLRRDGFGSEAIGQLACPIGVEGIHSNWPAAIAVAVAAQLMQLLSQAAPRERPGSRAKRVLPAVVVGDAPGLAASGCDAGQCDNCGRGRAVS